jgi:hypothetical protein
VTPCAPPSVTCNRTCTNVTSDLANCGECGRRCASGQSCVSGVCTTPVTTGRAGQACQRDSDCGPGGGCLSAGQGFLGGYCIYGCPAGAVAGDSCTGGTGVCIPVNGGQLLCLRSCTPNSSADCRVGYVCQSVTTNNSLGICYPNCALNAGAVCGAARCNTTTGQCQSAGCTTASQCSTGSVCASNVCECTAATSCGLGNRCYARTVTTPSYCGCSANAACANGETCDTSTGRCL